MIDWLREQADQWMFVGSDAESGASMEVSCVQEPRLSRLGVCDGR